MLKPIAVSLTAMVFAAGCQSDVKAPNIPFAALEDTSLKDPDNPRKTFGWISRGSSRRNRCAR